MTGHVTLYCLRCQTPLVNGVCRACQSRLMEDANDEPSDDAITVPPDDVATE